MAPPKKTNKRQTSGTKGPPSSEKKKTKTTQSPPVFMRRPSLPIGNSNNSTSTNDSKPTTLITTNTGSQDNDIEIPLPRDKIADLIAKSLEDYGKKTSPSSCTTGPTTQTSIFGSSASTPSFGISAVAVASHPKYVKLQSDFTKLKSETTLIQGSLQQTQKQLREANQTNEELNNTIRNLQDNANESANERQQLQRLLDKKEQESQTLLKYRQKIDELEKHNMEQSEEIVDNISKESKLEQLLSDFVDTSIKSKAKDLVSSGLSKEFEVLLKDLKQILPPPKFALLFSGYDLQDSDAPDWFGLYSQEPLKVTRKAKEAKDVQLGYSLSHLCAVFDNLDALSCLARYDTKMTQFTKNGNQPIHVALLAGNIQIAQFLVENNMGGELHKPNKKGWTAIQLLFIGKDRDFFTNDMQGEIYHFVMAAKEKGLQVKQKDNYRRTVVDVLYHFHKELFDPSNPVFRAVCEQDGALPTLKAWKLDDSFKGTSTLADQISQHEYDQYVLQEDPEELDIIPANSD